MTGFVLHESILPLHASNVHTKNNIEAHLIQKALNDSLKVKNQFLSMKTEIKRLFD